MMAKEGKSSKSRVIMIMDSDEENDVDLVVSSQSSSSPTPSPPPPKRRTRTNPKSKTWRSDTKPPVKRKKGALNSINKQKANDDDDDITDFDATAPFTPSISSSPVLPKSIPPCISQIIESQLWVDKYAPTASARVAIHKKKAGEVRDALSQPGKGIHVLYGPPGASKSTIVYCIAREMGIQIEEWTDPVSEGFQASSLNENWTSSISAFRNFLKSASQAPALLLSSDLATVTNTFEALDKKVILIQELPYCHTSRAKEELECCFRDYLASPRSKYPVFIILSTRDDIHFLSSSPSSSSSFKRDDSLDHVFFPIPAECRTSPYYHEIKFNPIAPTYLKSALTRILQSEGIHKKMPGLVSDEIMALADGDIRVAIHNFQFQALLLLDPLKSKSASGMGIKTETTSLFHGLGRILYPDKSESTSKECGFPENVLESVHNTDSGTFCLFLHQNYLPLHVEKGAAKVYSGKDVLDSFADVTRYLSDSDLMMGRWETRSHMEDIATSLFLRSLTHQVSQLGKTGGSKGSRTLFTFRKPEWFACASKIRSSCLWPDPLVGSRMSRSPECRYYVSFLAAHGQSTSLPAKFHSSYRQNSQVTCHVEGLDDDIADFD